MDLISSDFLTVEAERTWEPVIWSFLPRMQWGSIALTGAFFASYSGFPTKAFKPLNRITLLDKQFSLC